jgi:sulfoxide reductase catalytic subunit YedY
MLIKKSREIPYSEITPKQVYLDRRKLLAALPAALWAGRELLSPRPAAAARFERLNKSPLSVSDEPTPYKSITHYNNFYEFSTAKTEVADLAKNFKTSPWTVSVEGLVKQPRKLSMDEIMAVAPLEERVYRHRCVEGWSMVAPWVGYSLSALLKQFQPTEKAKYVAFETYYTPGQMPYATRSGLEFPYVEGLRLDEAMHPLTLVAVGLYGDSLPPQDGAPVRLVLPWKYGYKSIKSLVKIKFVEKQPSTTWNMANPPAYGFYSNVNPNFSTLQYSQATELPLGSFRRKPTLMFNGYGDQVASLYSGMDLKKYY